MLAREGGLALDARNVPWAVCLALVVCCTHWPPAGGPGPGLVRVRFGHGLWRSRARCRVWNDPVGPIVCVRSLSGPCSDPVGLVFAGVAKAGISAAAAAGPGLRQSDHIGAHAGPRWLPPWNMHPPQIRIQECSGPVWALRDIWSAQTPPHPQITEPCCPPPHRLPWIAYQPFWNGFCLVSDVTWLLQRRGAPPAGGCSLWMWSTLPNQRRWCCDNKHLFRVCGLLVHAQRPEGQVGH